MADDRGLSCPYVPHEPRQVVDIFGQRVAAAFRPVGIAVAAKVGGEHMKMRLQCAGDCVPATAMIAPAMDQKQGRSILIAPVGVMQPQALRDEEAALRSGHCSFNPCPQALSPEGIAPHDAIKQRLYKV